MTGAWRPGARARLAGALYGVSAVPAGFSIWVYSRLVVRGDSVATSARIVGSEGLFRLGFVAEITGVLLFLSSVLLLYRIFRPVSADRAAAMACFGVVGGGIQVLDSLADIAALILLKGGPSLSALAPGQAQALAHVLLRMHMITYDLALVFFGTSFVVLGSLVLQSRFLPRILGALVVVDGLGYVTSAFAFFLSPPLAARLHPFLPFVTAFLGEVPLMLWLIIRGVDEGRWEEQAARGSALPARAIA